MKFIPQHSKKARLLSQALARSLDIDTFAANNAVALMYGHSRWTVLCKAMLNGQPSMWDEQITLDEVDARQTILIERLRDGLSLDDNASRTLVQHLKPTAQAKSQVVAINQRPAGPGGSPVEDYNAITEAFGKIGNAPNPDAVLGGLLKEAMGTAGETLPADFDFDKLSDRLRVAKPVDPGAYFDILQSLGWPLDESSFEQDYVTGEPSFFAESQTGHVPVYITALAMIPEDDNDALAQAAMVQTEADNRDNMGTERLILLWSQPVVKVIDGAGYSYWGCLWQDGQWRDFLINGEMDCADRLFALNPPGQTANRPSRSQADPDHDLAKAVVIFLHGLQAQREQVKMATIPTPSGWETLLPSLQ
ncbi:MAG: hypothetical protein V7707_01185 [Motiliproteus sp.]